MVMITIYIDNLRYTHDDRVTGIQRALTTPVVILQFSRLRMEPKRDTLGD